MKPSSIRSRARASALTALASLVPLVPLIAGACAFPTAEPGEAVATVTLEELRARMTPSGGERALLVNFWASW